MELTETQYAPIASCSRDSVAVSMPNLQVLNAILYVAEQGCKWRGLPRRFGNWHHCDAFSHLTIFTVGGRTTS